MGAVGAQEVNGGDPERRFRTTGRSPLGPDSMWSSINKLVNTAAPP